MKLKYMVWLMLLCVSQMAVKCPLDIAEGWAELKSTYSNAVAITSGRWRYSSEYSSGDTFYQNYLYFRPAPLIGKCKVYSSTVRLEPGINGMELNLDKGSLKELGTLEPDSNGCDPWSD